jgi:hypothetical protein
MVPRLERSQQRDCALPLQQDEGREIGASEMEDSQSSRRLAVLPQG